MGGFDFCCYQRNHFAYQILLQKRNSFLRLDDFATLLRRRLSSCTASVELLDEWRLYLRDEERQADHIGYDDGILSAYGVRAP